MVFKTFLLKYGEIGIKGKNRGQFEDALVSRIRHVLSGVEGSFDVHKEQGRIYVDVLGDDNSFDPDEVIAALQKVFGLRCRWKIRMRSQRMRSASLPMNMA